MCVNRVTQLGMSPCRMLPASHLLRDSAWRCHGWRAPWARARRRLHTCEHRLPPDSHSKGEAVTMYHMEQHHQTLLSVLHHLWLLAIPPSSASVRRGPAVGA